MKKRDIVVFAQVPPPEHGQSRMVATMLEVLAGKTEQFRVSHIDARFSLSLGEIGSGSVRKLFRCFLYLCKALKVRTRLSQPVLYYVPGPVKWSAIIRDWILLAGMRPFFPTVVFHWHAIGHGEWAHGSERQGLAGPQWLVSLARRISAHVLHQPDLSIAVSATSRKDADAVESNRVAVVPNGIIDPCPEYQFASHGAGVDPETDGESSKRVLRVLFLAHGTREKGLLDLLKALRLLGQREGYRSKWSIRLTLAGGVSSDIRTRYDQVSSELADLWGSDLKVEEKGFVSGQEKWQCYAGHDVFVVPSRWESFGLTVAEAMAFGLPVVATASDGVTGVLPEGYPYMAGVAAPDELADILDKASHDWAQGALQKWSGLLRTHFEDHFQLSHFSDGIVCAFDQAGKEPEGHGEQVRAISICTYLADQNPMLGRSLGISRMTEVVLQNLAEKGDVELIGVVSRSSVKPPQNSADTIEFPWSTRSKLLRILTDHFHPLLTYTRVRPDLWYFPKGFMPGLGLAGQSVVTIHDTIIQYYQDHHPKWRLELEYNYWAGMLRNTLLNASAVMTVSENAKRQIQDFLRRHDLPDKEIHVTYEPCLYESIPQPESPAKADYVLHLGSREPHKRTEWLVKLWSEWERRSDLDLPHLHIVGSVPDEVAKIVAESSIIVCLPFLEDQALVSQFKAAKALIFPSEIEGFGLPAIEAYYLGTPVCYQQGTSVEEVLEVATDQGAFDLDDPESLLRVLFEVMEMDESLIREIGLKLRETYSADSVVKRMLGVFRKVAMQSEAHCKQKGADQARAV